VRDIGGNPRCSIFRREDDVQQRAYVRVHDGRFIFSRRASARNRAIESG
jgi:hypothetical protein